MARVLGCSVAGLRSGVLGTLVLFVCATPTPTRAARVDPNTWITDADVHALAQSGNTIYLGGNFTRLAPARGLGVPIDGTTGVPLANFPKVAGPVWACIPDGVGGWYVGGDFAYVGGQPRRSLAHILANGTLSPWNPRLDVLVGWISTLALSGNTLYVGGNFLYAPLGGVTRHNALSLDATTGDVTAWDPNTDGWVKSLNVSGSTMYIGGQFSVCGGQLRNCVAAVSASSGLANSWDPDAGLAHTLGGTSVVNSIVPSGSVVYVGGSFSQVGGQPRANLAAINVAGGTASAWTANTNGPVYSIVPNSGLVYASGLFTTVHGLPRTGIAAINASTGIPTAFSSLAGINLNADGPTSFAIANGVVYAAADVMGITPADDRNGLAAFDAGTGALRSWNPDVNGKFGVLTVAASGNVVYAGGMFVTVGGVVRNKLAAIDATTGQPTAWNPNADGPVSALLTDGSTVYAGGQFSQIGSAVRNDLAAIHGTTGVATAWNPNPTPDPNANAEVVSLAMGTGVLYAGGNFTRAGGQDRANLAALSTTTGAATAWSADTDAPVWALAPSGSTLYVGGEFGTIAGVPRSYAAAVSTSSGAVLGWAPEADGAVSDLLVNAGTVYACGAFQIIGNALRNGLAALDNTNGDASSWIPSFGTGGVGTLVQSGGSLYAAGQFVQADGQPRSCLAAFDASGTLTPWNAGGGTFEYYSESGFVNALVVNGNSAFVGGHFDTVGPEPQAFFARISTSLVDAPQQQAPASGVAMSAPWPNPSRGAARIELELPTRSTLAVVVVDVQGRRVRTLAAAQPHAAGRVAFVWDGRDDDGARVASGVYFVRAITEGGNSTRRVVIEH